jgi:two-component system LytT family response regulator
MKTNHTTASPTERRNVGFPYKGGIHFFKPEQIIRLEADSNYTYIHLKGQKPILMAKVLAAYEVLLQPFGFIRTHRSHLVNKQHIMHVDQQGVIVMDDESTAVISRSKRKEVFIALSESSNAA